MAEPSKKQSFLHGTVLLALSAAIVKVIGAFYKIPLNQIIGEQGFGYFNTAYDIYSVLMAIAVAGLPVAVSRLISESSALGHYNQVRRIFSTARTIFISMGLLGTLAMVLFCKQLAVFQEQPDAWFAIGCLGPAVLLTCTISALRGFFQGQSNMGPTALSQVLEAACKLVVGIGLASLLMHITGQYVFASGGAILGVSASCLLSVIYLFFRYRKAKALLPVSDEVTTGFWRTAWSLLRISLPIAAGAAGLSFLTTLETKVYMSQLIGLGYAQEQADMMKGIYDMGKTIFNLPIAFVTPITISIVPAITAYVAMKDHGNAKATEESAMRVLSLIIAPCAVGLVVLAEPVMGLLGGYTGDKLELGGTLMALLSTSLLLYAMILVTNAIMQAHGRPGLPVINMIIGGIIKLGCTFILTRNPNLGIVGAPIGALMGYLAIATLNLLTLRRCSQEPPAILRQLVRPLLAAVMMGVLVLAVRMALQHWMGENASRLILTAVPVMVGVAVYGFTAIKLKAITRSDCLLLPKGEKIANLLHL